MNKVILIGRCVTDPEIRYTQGDKPTCVAQVTLAVERKYKKNNDVNADFPRIKTFGKTAELFEKYIKKGTKIAVTGSIQTGSYTDRNGNKVYTTDVFVDEVEFCESKNSSSTQDSAPKVDSDGFMSIPTGTSDELPFC